MSFLSVLILDLLLTISYILLGAGLINFGSTYFESSESSTLGVSDSYHSDRSSLGLLSPQLASFDQRLGR